MKIEHGVIHALDTYPDMDVVVREVKKWHNCVNKTIRYSSLIWLVTRSRSSRSVPKLYSHALRPA